MMAFSVTFLQSSHFLNLLCILIFNKKLCCMYYPPNAGGMQPDFTPVKIFSIYPANAACTQIYHSLFSKRTASRPPQYIHTSENRQFYYLPRPAPQSSIIRPVQISKFPFAQFIRYIGICYFFDPPIVVKNKYRYILMLKFFRKHIQKIR